MTTRFSGHYRTLNEVFSPLFVMLGLDQHGVVANVAEEDWVPVFVHTSEWAHQRLDRISRTCGRLTKYTVTGLTMTAFSMKHTKRDRNSMEDWYPRNRLMWSSYRLGGYDLKLGGSSHVFGGHEAKLDMRYPFERIVPFHMLFLRGRRLIALGIKNHCRKNPPFWVDAVWIVMRPLMAKRVVDKFDIIHPATKEHDRE
jgi:hypothetical protein